MRSRAVWRRAVASLPVLAALVVAAPAGASTHPGRASSVPHSTPLQRAGLRAGAVPDQQSTNWSGVADTASKTRFTSVGATWQVPTAVRAQGSPAGDTYSSSWVGIGGDLDDDFTLIQAGTEQDVSSTGVASYDAWYELLPQVSVEIDDPVEPGDTVTVTITETNTTKQDWTISVADATQAWSFVKNVYDYESSNASAEWIEEAPTVGNGQTNMADFQSVTFAQLQVNGQSTLAPSGTVPSRIDYVNGAGTVLAYPEGYDVADNSFAITYGTPTSLALGLLPDAREGAPYSATLGATGGLSPYTIDATGVEDLPAGLSFDPTTNVISGTPTATGTGTFDVTVHDDAGHSLTGVVSLDALGTTFLLVQGPPTWLKDVGGSTFRRQLALTAVQPISLTGAVRFVTTSASHGVAVTATGVVIAPATTPIGVYRASGTDSDAEGDAGTWTVTIEVVHPTRLVVVTNSLPAATVGVRYSVQLVAFGPKGSPTWSVAKGRTLPKGLTLSKAGQLAGTPAAAAKGAHAVRLVVADGGRTKSVSLTLRVV